jgi:hypothetical protein
MANLSRPTYNACPRVTDLFLSTRDTYLIPIYLHVIPVTLSWQTFPCPYIMPCPRVTGLILSTRDTYLNVMAIPIYLHVISIPL